MKMPLFICLLSLAVGIAKANIFLHVFVLVVSTSLGWRCKWTDESKGVLSGKPTLTCVIALFSPTIQKVLTFP